MRDRSQFRTAAPARPMLRQFRRYGLQIGHAVRPYDRPLLGERGMLVLYAASALRALGWFGPFLYFGAFYGERHGLSLRQADLAYMVASAGMFAGNLAAGRWLARRDLRRAFAATTALLALAWCAVYTLPLATAPAVSLVTLSPGAAGVGWIALTSLLAAGTPAGPGTTMTLNSAAFAAGSALGGVAGGLLVGLGGYALLGTALPVATARRGARWHRAG